MCKPSSKYPTTVIHIAINRQNSNTLSTRAELVDGKEKVAKPTMFMEAVSEYKKIRTKVAPLVGAKKKGTCAVM